MIEEVKFGKEVKFWAEMWEYSPQNCKKIRILARNLYLWGDLFAIFLRNSEHLYASSFVTFE